MLNGKKMLPLQQISALKNAAYNLYILLRKQTKEVR
jgi:hypothetical protein